MSVEVWFVVMYCYIKCGILRFGYFSDERVYIYIKVILCDFVI